MAYGTKIALLFPERLKVMIILDLGQIFRVMGHVIFSFVRVMGHVISHLETCVLEHMIEQILSIYSGWCYFSPPRGISSLYVQSARARN